MNKKFDLKEIGASVWAFLAPFLPMALIALVVYIIWNKIKANGGVLNMLGAGIGLPEDGHTAGIKANKEVLQKVAEKAKQLSYIPNANHVAIANAVYNAINTINLNPFDRTLGAEDTRTVVNNLASMSATYDFAMVYLAYGTREVNNRQNVILGFIWDNTDGTIIDHVNRFIGSKYDKNKQQIIQAFNIGLKKYLNL